MYKFKFKEKKTGIILSPTDIARLNLAIDPITGRAAAFFVDDTGSSGKASKCHANRITTDDYEIIIE